jgi:1,2-diacylglycerol 3-alpha-glucosyltransferase
MSKLKIAFYTDRYLPLHDGVITYIKTMRKELERRGHEVFVITSGGKETHNLAKKDGHLIVLNGLRFIDGESTVAFDPLILRQVINDKKLDIIHAHNPFILGLSARIIAGLTKVKLVSTFHTYYFHKASLNKWLSLISKFLSSNKFAVKLFKSAMIGYLKWYYKKCAYIISPSKFAKRLLARQGIKNVEVVENPIEFEEKSMISKEGARRLLGIHKNDRVILYLGRIGEEKNLKFLLRAAPALKKNGFKIIIAGTGPKLVEYRNKSLLLGLDSVSFPGFVKDSEKKYYYRAADIFCNPSTFDTSCIAAMEALNYNLPILVPANSAQAEYVEKGKCGETFQVNDQQDFIAKALKIAGNGRSYSPRTVARKFNVQIIANKLLALYKRVLAD